MPRRVVLLSGPIASGKTVLGDGLIARFGLVRIRTREVIRERMTVNEERGGLQAAGDRLDRKTEYRWIAAAVARLALERDPDDVILVDAVRKKKQIDAVRQGFGQRVVHVHLNAPRRELARRYRERNGPVKEKRSYKAASEHATERQVARLADVADIVIDSSTCTPEDLVVRVAARVGLYGRGCDRLVDVLVGGQWGSEGKGQVSAYLAPEYDVLLRVGGPNAGHQVYGEPKRTFYHIPSGTERNENATVVLGPGSVIRLRDRRIKGKLIPGLATEIRRCGLTRDRLHIDPQAMMIEDEDIEFEKRLLVKSLGSTGQGVGAATARKALRLPRRFNQMPKVRLARDERELKDYIRPTGEVLEDAFAHGRRVFLEGTQGTGLSLHHGEYRFVTSRDTTISGCLADSGIPPARVRKTIMVCRSYPIRVQGNSGPMGHEIEWKDVARRSRIPLDSLVDAEKTSTTSRDRRVAEFDWRLFRRSVSLNAPTDIALTFADYFLVGNREARRFEQLSVETREFIEEMERVASAPVSLVAVRFHYRPIIDRRFW